MSLAATPLLTRLRRHRGLWLLVLAVLLVKLVSSSVCLGDRLALVPAPGDTTTLTVTSAHAEAACLLGEAGDCHCACVHALPLASHGVASLHALAPIALTALPRAVDHRPAATGSLLRPPIA